jgi:predicted PurR-regulated permease PerM
MENKPPLSYASTSNTYYQPEWSQWFRQFMTVALVIATVYGLTLLAPVLQILIITFLLAFLMYVPARFIAASTRFNFQGGVIVSYLILISLIVLFILILVPNIVNFFQSIPSGLRDLQTRLISLLESIEPNSVVIPIINVDLEPLLGPLRQLLLNSTTAIAPDGTTITSATDTSTAVTDIASALPAFDIGQIVNVASGTIGSLLGTISGLFSTLFLAIFLSLMVLLDLPRYQNQLFHSIQPEYQRETRLLFDKISFVWRGFFRGQVTLGVIIGFLTAIQLMLMGVRQPVVIAMIVALISLIPSIGGFISLIPLAVIPLIYGSTVFVDMGRVPFALLVVGINLVWTQIIWNVVAPKIMGDAVSLPLPVIIIGIVIGAALGGAIGAFLIVPIAGTLRVLVFYVLAKINRRDPFPGEATPELVQLSTL